MTIRMLRIIVVVIEVVFEVEKEGWGWNRPLCYKSYQKGGAKYFLPTTVPPHPHHPCNSSTPSSPRFCACSIVVPSSILISTPPFAAMRLHPLQSPSKTTIYVFPASLLSPILHLDRCRRPHFTVSTYPMSLFFFISGTAMVRCRCPPLTFSAIPIISCISDASIVIHSRLRCSPHCVVFHCPASFDAVICLSVSCFSYVSSAASIFYCSQISTVAIPISNPPYPLLLFFFPCILHHHRPPPFIGTMYFYRRHPSGYAVIISILCCCHDLLSQWQIIHLLSHSTLLDWMFSFLLDLLIMHCSDLPFSLLTPFRYSLLVLLLYLSTPLRFDILYRLLSAAFFSTCIHSTLIGLDHPPWFCLLSSDCSISAMINSDRSTSALLFFFSFQCLLGLDQIYFETQYRTNMLNII